MTVFLFEKKWFLLNTRDVRVSGCSGDNADVSKRFGFCGKKETVSQKHSKHPAHTGRQRPESMVMDLGSFTG